MMRNIILERNEIYTNDDNCWPFCKGSDIKNGIELKLGNMLSGFPFQVNGHDFICSEILYLCGQFSLNNDKHINIQKELINSNNGFIAKKFVKNKNQNEIRKDFNEFRIQWMLWTVWQKTKNNNDFQKLLKSIPDNAIIIEDSTWQNSNTATLWGCKSIELKKYKIQLKKEITKDYPLIKKSELNRLINKKMQDINIKWEYHGQNVMGKILMLCKYAIENNKEPDIDYDLLHNHEIYLMGKRLF